MRACVSPLRVRMRRVRARALLRSGADLRAAAATGGPTPLSLAQQMQAVGDAPGDSAAELVLFADQPWSPHTHNLFPGVARARAEAVVWPLYSVARERLQGRGMEAVVFSALVLRFDVLRQ